MIPFETSDFVKINLKVKYIISLKILKINNLKYISIFRVCDYL